MKETMQDIRYKISNGVYQKEEHVRICVVARLLQRLGWDIWNPEEVCAEYVPNRDEDSTRVDFALFSSKRSPCVFVEIKPVGRIRQNLEESERQLRDYNRNLTAVFSILTDGQTWRLYLSQSGGDFSSKCFKVVNLLEDELEDIEDDFRTFLAKEEVGSGRAEIEARSYLRLSQKQQVMDDCLSQARKLINQPPYPNLPSALAELVNENGVELSIEEAFEFINSAPVHPAPELPVSVPPEPPRPRLSPADGDGPPGGFAKDRSFPPDSPPSLKHAKLEVARICGKPTNKWNGLLDTAIAVAVERGITIDQIRKIGVNIQKGHRTDSGYHSVPGTDLSVQGMNSDNCYLSAYHLAMVMRVQLQVHFRWRDKDGALHPGERGVIQYVP